MKIIKRSALALTLGSILVTQTGCFGTFALTRKTYEYHDGISSSKFVKSLLFWIPGGLVYGVVGFIDVVILNLIEFWSGTNPLSMNEDDHEMQLVTIKGVDYRIDATKDTFTTTQLTGGNTGEVRVMKFDRCDHTWKYTDSNVAEVAVMTFVNGDADAVRVYTDNGTMELTYDELADAHSLAGKLANCGLAMAK